MAAEPQLVDYIKKARDMGQSDDQTRTLLYQNGWTEAEVNDALAEISQPIIQPQSQPQPQPAQPQVQQTVQPQTQTQPQTKLVQPKYQDVAQNMMPIEGRKTHTAFKLTVALIILIIIGIAGFFALGQPNFSDILSKFINVTSKTPAKNTSNTSPVATAFIRPGFGQYNLNSTPYTPALPEYQVSLSELANLNNFQKSQGNFSTAQQNALTTDNFFVAKNNDKNFKGDDWTYLYGKIGGSSDATQRQPENSVFITTDFLTHAYSKLINGEFSNLQENNFYPAIDALSKSLLASSASAYGSTTVQEQKDSFDRLSSYFLVTSAILDNGMPDYQKLQQSNSVDDSKSDTKNSVLATADLLAQSNNVPDDAKSIAEQEISLIFDANATTSSPLMGNFQQASQEDYTQFAPTGYYTQNVIFRDYFRAMQFYGNMNFLLSSSELTRDAANIALLLSSDKLKQWESVYQPTSFFAGQGDDLTIYEVQDAENKVGFNSSVNDDATLTKLQSQLATYQNPEVASYSVNQKTANPTKGFRFMSQMLSPDAFIFSNLTQTNGQPDSATGQILPTMPTGLMISTLMGSNVSSDLLNTWITKNNPNSDKILANNISTLQSYLTNAPQQRWIQNSYWSLLYATKSVFTDNVDKTGYPMFVKSSDWDTKNLQTFLGSWTEAKNNSLAYSGQNSASSTTTVASNQNSAANPVPKGYVEPNVDFLDRLIASTNMVDNGLNQYSLESSSFQSNIKTFENDLTFYRTIAVSELQNQAISDSDFEKLRLSAGQLDSALQQPAKSALISNVFTDTTNNKFLYEADGIPNYIYVAVKDANGTRLTKGLVYSYYEFTGSASKQYTNSVWQGWEYSSVPQKLQMPWWSKSLMP